MSRRREYHTNAERQAAYRQRKRQAAIDNIPKVEGNGYTIYQGDALTIVPLVGHYDHCITDPPYEGKAHTGARRTRAFLEGRDIHAKLTFAPITEAQRLMLARLQCGWLLAFCQGEALWLYQAALGPRYKTYLVWHKPDSTPQLTGDRAGIAVEHIACGWMRPGRSTWNSGGKRGHYTYYIHDKEARVHPTQKPIGLMKELVRDFTQPGDVVLDPFMGSGSTGVAALAEGRRFIGIEQDPTYFALACKRLAATARQGTLFPPRAAAKQVALFG